VIGRVEDALVQVPEDVPMPDTYSRQGVPRSIDSRRGVGSIIAGQLSRKVRFHVGKEDNGKAVRRHGVRSWPGLAMVRKG